MKNQKLNPLALGLAFGIYFGIGLFILGLTSTFRGYAKIFVSFMKTFYIWYDYTVLGSFAWLGRWFVDGFVWAFVIARLYNLISSKFKK